MTNYAYGGEMTKHADPGESTEIGPIFPETWNHVNGKPFDAPLPDGKPVEIPEEWKLPPEMRGWDRKQDQKNMAVVASNPVIRIVNPHDLHPHPYNDKIYGTESIDDLKEEIKKSGWIKPLVVNQSNVIISGHRRWRAAIGLGMDVPIESRDFVSEVDELEALLWENFYRQKTTAQKGLEGKTWKHIFTERNKEKQQVQGAEHGAKGAEHGAKGGRGHKKEEETPLAARAAKGVSSKDKRKKQVSRTSDQVASLVGLGSGDTFERVEKALDTAQQLTEEGKPDLAQTLLDLVNESKGVAPAAEVAEMEPQMREAVLDMLVSGEAKTVKGAKLEIEKASRDAQAQAAPTKPKVTLASWDTWLSIQPECDLLITDPPYSTDVENIESFAQSWLPPALAKVKTTGRAYVCIGAYPQELKAYLSAQTSMKIHQILVWSYKNTLGPKPTHDYKQNWQAILYFVGKDAPALDCPELNEQNTVMEINAPDGRQGDRYHTWQKPDVLAERLIRHSTKQGDTVLDCFAGTGTFLLAAHRLGRIASGCDCSEDMIKIAEQRGCEVQR